MRIDLRHVILAIVAALICGCKTTANEFQLQKRAVPPQPPVAQEGSMNVTK
jgi:hypothetical protein